MGTQPILELHDIEKSFSGNHVLKKMNLDVLSGEVMGIVGENGAGKSTLMKIITGVYSLDRGEIRFEGKQVAFANSKDALHAGIAIIHQEFNLFQNLTVAENIYLDREEYRSRSGRIDWKKMRLDAQKVLAELGASFSVDTLVSELGVREQQLIEIAKAVSSHAKVLIMDEPSAALPQNEVQHLFNVIGLLKAKGCSVIYVSHRMQEIEEICDRVTVLRNGVNVGVLTTKENSIDHIITLMCGRKIQDYYPHKPLPFGKTALTVSDLSNRFVRNVSFEVREREILGIYGLAGSGSTQLAECLFGLSEIEHGTVETRKGVLKKTSPKSAMDLGIAYVPPDRRREGIVKELSIALNMVLSKLAEYSSGLLLNRTKIDRTAERYIEMLKISATSKNQVLSQLSGGNQQKVVLGRWLDANPDVLLLNEPTRGVDIGAKVEIYALIDDLAKKGLSIILISSEIPEVLGMCDRVLVMNKGEISGEFENCELTQETLLRAASKIGGDGL